MYSMVLMMAMSTSPEAATFHPTGGGCSGCTGAVVIDAGCCGGGHAHSFKLFGGSSCCGGGHSFKMFGGTGCCGGGHKMFGGSMFGGHKHGCCGGVPTSCTGCTGAPIEYAAPAPVYAPAPVIGCAPSAVPVVIPPAPMMMPAPAPMAMPAPAPMAMPAPMAAPAPMPVPVPKPMTAAPAPATIIVSVPADATLTFDGYKTVAANTTRTFTTPALIPGNVYSYEIVAEVVRNGKTIQAIEKVRIRAGDNTTLTITPSEAVVSR